MNFFTKVPHTCTSKSTSCAWIVDNCLVYVPLQQANRDAVPVSRNRWPCLFLEIIDFFISSNEKGKDYKFSVTDPSAVRLLVLADKLKILVIFQRVFLEGNPYLLVITMVVSLLHSVFDFLAFKNGKFGSFNRHSFISICWGSVWILWSILWAINLIISFADIQFWNKNKSMEGLSAKSVVVNFICQLIVFLYLLDNDTSWMILASSGVGCCIEFWKIGKAMHIEVSIFY